VRVSTQLPLQSVWPAGQPQTPPLHTCSSFGHVLKQSPQLVRSLALLTQAPLHSSGKALWGSHTQPFAVASGGEVSSSDLRGLTAGFDAQLGWL
jgi:hypothetical protein